VFTDESLFLGERIDDPAAMNNPTITTAANIPGTEKAVLIYCAPTLPLQKHPSD
jgi:hypothetical protein